MASNKMDKVSHSSKDWLALCSAVILRQPTLILNLLKQNVDFRCTDENGNTILHKVFQKYTINHNEPLIIEILNIFFDYGMNPNVMNNDGKTALHLAIKSRLCDVIDFLIKKGADLNIVDKDNNVIAHFVVDCEFDQYCRTCWSESYATNEKNYAKDKSKHFVRWLFSKGLSVNHKNNDGLTPLHLAGRLNLQFIMLELLNHTGKRYVNYVNKNNQNILHSLFDSLRQTEPLGFKNEKKSVSIPFREEKRILSSIVESLLEKGISVDAVDNQGNTPLHLALRLTETDITDLMVQKFTNVNACDRDGNTVLHIILMDCRDYWNIEIYDDYIRILLSKGANINIKNKNGLVPLQIAVLKKRVNIVKLMKKYKANFQVLHENGNLLHFFATNSLKDLDKTTSRTIVDLLVSEGCDVNSRNELGMTPLHLALKSCNVYVVNRLIELGANIDARQLFKQKYTTLHLAVIHGYEDHIDTFIRAGVNVNAQDANGQTPLHLASGNSKIMKKILRLGAYVDQYDFAGNTPLHMALRQENIAGVLTLIRHGADITDINTRTEVESLIENRQIAFVIIQHWLKLKNACLPVIEPTNDWMDSYYQKHGSSFDWESMNFERDCEEEIKKLKKLKIQNNVSWYDFLHMNRNRQSSFVKTNDFRSKVCAFPIYEPVILGAYYQAKARIPLLRLAVNAWYELELANHYLPDMCVEQIYAHFSNANLRDIIKMFNMKIDELS